MVTTRIRTGAVVRTSSESNTARDHQTASTRASSQPPSPSLDQIWADIPPLPRSHEEIELDEQLLRLQDSFNERFREEAWVRLNTSNNERINNENYGNNINNENRENLLSPEPTKK